MGFLLMAAMTLAGPLATSSPEALTRPAQVLDAVRVRGAQATAAALWASSGWRQYMAPGVRSADPGWLAAALAIHPGTDAGASEELSDALAAALLKDPYATLPVVQAIWWAAPPSKTCVFGIDSELQGGPRAYVASLEKALGRQPPPGAAKIRSLCLAGLAETKTLLAETSK